jgi:hypothetical protein
MSVVSPVQALLSPADLSDQLSGAIAGQALTQQKLSGREALDLIASASTSRGKLVDTYA